MRDTRLVENDIEKRIEWREGIKKGGREEEDVRPAQVYLLW